MNRRPPRRFAPGWIVGGVVASSFLFAHGAWADEPEPSEAITSPTVYPAPSAQPNLILIGAGVTAGWYGAAFGLSYLWPDSPGASAMRIPVAGPYMSLFKTGCGRAESGCGTFTLVIRTVLTSLTAVGQTGGVLAMVEGLFLPTASTERPPSKPSRLARFQFSPVAPAPIGFSSTTDPVLETFVPKTGSDDLSHGEGIARRNASGLAPLGLTISGAF